MTNYGAIIGGDTDIEFETVTAMLEGEVESGKGVLPDRIPASTYASVSEKQWTRCHGSVFYFTD